MRKFEPHELFCSICLIHESFFDNIGVHMAEECPQCHNARCTRYENLTPSQKIEAEKNYDIKYIKKIRSYYHEF